MVRHRWDSWIVCTLLVTTPLISSCGREGKSRLEGLWRSDIELTILNNEISNGSDGEFIRSRLGSMFHYFGEHEMVSVFRPRINGKELLSILRNEKSVPVHDEGHVISFHYEVVEKGGDKVRLDTRKSGPWYEEWFVPSDQHTLRFHQSGRCFSIETLEGDIDEFFCKVIGDKHAE